MMMNGTIVYNASMGMLYRVCGGTSTLVLLRRWKITLHRIRPQTSTPVASAAAQEPCQRERIRGASSVTGRGHTEAGEVLVCATGGGRQDQARSQHLRQLPPHRAPRRAVGAVGTHVAPSRESRPRGRLRPSRWSVAGPGAGRGLDVYADQTLLDAIWGRAGRVPNAPRRTPKGWPGRWETLTPIPASPGI